MESITDGSHTTLPDGGWVNGEMGHDPHIGAVAEPGNNEGIMLFFCFVALQVCASEILASSGCVFACAGVHGSLSENSDIFQVTADGDIVRLQLDFCRKNDVAWRKRPVGERLAFAVLLNSTFLVGFAPMLASGLPDCLPAP